MSKSIKLVKPLHRHRIHIACVQKIMWVELKPEILMSISSSILGLIEREMELVFWSTKRWLINLSS